MTPAQYRAYLAALGLTQEAAGKLFDVSLSTAWRYAKHGPPRPVAMLLIQCRDVDELRKLAIAVSELNEKG